VQEIFSCHGQHIPVAHEKATVGLPKGGYRDLHPGRRSARPVLCAPFPTEIQAPDFPVGLVLVIKTLFIQGTVFRAGSLKGN